MSTDFFVFISFFNITKNIILNVILIYGRNTIILFNNLLFYFLSYYIIYYSLLFVCVCYIFLFDFFIK